MSGFGAKARQFMGWYTPEEVDESTLDFLPEEVEEKEVAHITPASNVTPILREERRSVQQADLSRIVTVRVGLTYGLQGVFERVTDRVFLLSPHSVEVTGDVTGSNRSATSLFGR